MSALAITALVVVAALAGYASYLWARVWLHQRQQRQLQQQQRAERNARLLDSIRTIAWAAEQEQCELAEAALRLCVLLDLLAVPEGMALADRFPALHGLYAAIREQPIGDARSALKRNERMRLDVERHQAESEWAERLKPELTALRHFQLESA
ncbi:MAG: DUF2489 domain-containing protein [Gammaproteobacteria bacterium]|nr:DUF2489 domain-containing protein [Gammaproteobacteria bacterium]